MLAFPRRTVPCLVLVALAIHITDSGLSAAADVAESKSAVRQIEFNRDVRPILSENCFACHGFDEAAREANLRLDTRAGATGDDGGVSAIVPGNPLESELVARIMSDDADLLMPPADSGKKLTSAEKETLQLWIEQGASYDLHWSFVAPNRSQPPSVGGVPHPIDRFVRARLAKEGISPSPQADVVTLIRRLSLDLTGLPPSLAEIDRFTAAAKKDRDTAYRDLVDHLLLSPHYGERWGRWWLDQARYADSNGYSIDSPRQIWHYRDWVVNALNDDMPFDTFTIEQLAGDLLPDATQSQRIATGFHRNTQINQEGGIDQEQFRIDSVFDRVATTGTVWLGLTIGCAQCHDHKFDPITQVDFYRMFAFLNNQDEPSMKVYSADVDVQELTQQLKIAEQELSTFFQENGTKMDEWETAQTPESLEKLASSIRSALKVEKTKRSLDHKRSIFAPIGDESSGQQLNRLWSRYEELDRALNHVATTLVLSERKQPRQSFVLIKGDFTRPAEEVSPGTPSILHPMEKVDGPANRLDLARWITSNANPLTARVIVNRVWQQYFGRGLSEIENDFGLQGTSPTHPELLDWLAVEFVDRGWSLKELHRLIVTSQTYQQSSRARPDLEDKDRENYLLARQRRLRLDAEIVRDVALAASGLLSTKLGGPPVYPPIPDGVMNQGQVNQKWNASEGDDRYRRGLYTFKFRATPPPSLNVFDAPDGFSTCTQRVRSNTPLQALTLMNDPASVEFAHSLEKIIKNDGIENAFRRCTARLPSRDELAILSSLDTFNAARALLNLDETITRE